jgi:hypothetical protein
MKSDKEKDEVDNSRLFLSVFIFCLEYKFVVLQGGMKHGVFDKTKVFKTQIYTKIVLREPNQSDRLTRPVRPVHPVLGL